MVEPDSRAACPAVMSKIRSISVAVGKSVFMSSYPGCLALSTHRVMAGIGSIRRENAVFRNPVNTPDGLVFVQSFEVPSKNMRLI